MAHPFLSQDFPVAWSSLDPAAIESDIQLALDHAHAAINAIADQDRGKLSFDSVVGALDEATKPLHEAWGLVNHLDALCNTPELREAHHRMLPKVSEFFASIALHEHLWDVLLTYSQTDQARDLPAVRSRALKETMDGFRQAGADLPPERKKRLQELESELSQVTQKYSENVLDSTNAWELLIDDSKRLEGLPQSALDAARADALSRGHGSEERPVYRFTQKAPSMIPVMEHAQDETLRRQVWEGSMTIGRAGSHDNTELVWRILALRHEKAQLLGRSHFADLVLEQRMARSGAKAMAFIEDLHGKVAKAFSRETIALQEFKADSLRQRADLLEPWELAFWAEKQRRAAYDFDEEELRPFFPIQQVLKGMFALAERVFDLRFSEVPTVAVVPGVARAEQLPPGAVEVWHPEVRFYEVRNEKGVHIGSFYADWHPRDSKRSGAWMNYLRMGLPPSGERDRRLHLGLICGNLTPPVEGRAALITHDEVCTVFHEFGHLLHQICGNVEVASLNGVNVYWDFVELPSQLMENFCWERESLDLFARHHETGKPIPAKLLRKLVATRHYRSATAIMRQLSFGKLDLELHMNHAQGNGGDLDEVSLGILRDYLIPTRTASPSMARRFGHLFSSPVGYAAGYYSYKWAEVLDADAFTRFQKEGILNPKVGREFRDLILARGNSSDPAELFVDFMGRPPEPQALLQRAGLA
jgi:oligopeptidase A